MKDIALAEIIDQALSILENDVGLAKSSLVVVASRSFKPISDYFKGKNKAHYNEELIKALESHYHESLKSGSISRNVFNQRMRGTRILREVAEIGTFIWKGPASKETFFLPEPLEQIATGFAAPDCSERRDRNAQSIVRSFLLSLANSGINDIAHVSPEHVQSFLSEISQSRAKSMDDVVSSLRKLDRYLTRLGTTGLPYAGLLMAPRARDRKIHPCMPQDDLDIIIQAIDRKATIGKRDYAILLLALSSGMRAGDIANIELSDIDWRKNELRIVQGKTQKPIILPLQKGVGSALADYILNGRPVSKSPQIFLRSLAPYQRFMDGVSVACVLRRRMKAVGILHEPGDGKTMHGIRRMLGTNMAIEGVPVTTISQVLGHQHIGATRPYISLDVERLRECALGFDSLGEVPND